MVNKLRPQAERLFYNKHPNGDASKFLFGYNTDETETKLLYIDIYLKSNLMSITDPRFKNNREWMSYLYGSLCSKIWRGGGTVVDLLSILLQFSC